MKRIILFSIFLPIIALSTAQNYEAAKSAFTLYKLDNSRLGKLKEALSSIDLQVQALELPIQNYSFWHLRGEIYNAVNNQIINSHQTVSDLPVELKNIHMPGLEESRAYRKALQLSEKSYEQKESLKGLRSAQLNNNFMAVNYYDEREYQNAYQAFKEVIDLHEILQQHNEETILSDDSDLDHLQYACGLAAMQAGLNSEAKSYFINLVTKDFDEALVYESLYRIESKTDPENAYQYLLKGRMKYPEDTNLIFAEINHLLASGKTTEVIGLLEKAVSKEPGNVTLYATLGSIYDSFWQSEFESGNVESAEEYYKQAISNYGKGLQIDPSNTDLLYSTGALYYNSAAFKAEEMNELAENEKENEEYSEIKEEMNDLFDESLVYFKKAESIDPNDLNVLYILKNIYLYQDNIELHNEFKSRMETIESGGRLPSSYFK